jgi:hypothetical protein
MPGGRDAAPATGPIMTGALGPTCKVGIPGGVPYIVHRDYLINSVRRFGNSATGKNY